MARIPGKPSYACLLLFIVALPANAQVVRRHAQASVTVEAFANITGGVANDRDADGRFDAALRVLGRADLARAPDLGARIVVQRSPESGLKLGEASVLLFGGRGRLEIGERMGLPDVLSGYAPNNFTFTGAEFGPASGPSLDPAGGLQTAFLDRALAAQIAPLTTLGFAASLFEDQSAKMLYVSPKTRGFLGGISYAPDADDPRYADLVQLGLTHERYRAQNVVRLGGSYAFARADRASAGSIEDLHSINIGVTATLDDSLTFGVSGTFNGDTGSDESSSGAWGTTASVNYNTGPWTVGGYYQLARSEGDSSLRGGDRLSAAEAGLSYRLDTRVRLYGAWFYYDFTDVDASIRRKQDGNVVVIGLRLTL